MSIFIDDLDKLTLKNKYYRKVINTNSKQQLVLMSLKPGEDIPKEIHKDISQFIKIEEGNGELIVNKKIYKFKEGFGIVIPPNTYHWIKNTSKTKTLKLYSIYCPSEHDKNRIDIREPKQEGGFIKKYKIKNLY